MCPCLTRVYTYKTIHMVYLFDDMSDDEEVEDDDVDTSDDDDMDDSDGDY